MEANKIYQNSITTLANLIKNEKLRTNLLYLIELKTQSIQIINNLLVLELEHECTFKDKKWSAIFGKSLVNILKEKIKFEKQDNKSLEDILSDIVFFQTYCFNNLQVSRDELTNESFEITEDFVKENSKITEELKAKYGETVTPEPEVVDKQKEKPNDKKSNKTAGAGIGGGPIPGFNSQFNNTFTQNGNLPLHPLQDQRFYPYNGKPKYMKYFKWGLGVSLILSALFYFVISLFITFDYFTINKDTLNGLSSVDQTVLEKFTSIKWTLSNSIYSSGANGIFGIIILILMVLMIGWIVYTIVQPPKIYKEKFMIPGMTLVVPSMFIFMMIFSFLNGFKFLFGTDIQLSVLASYFGNEILGKEGDALNTWANENKAWLTELSSLLDGELNFTLLRVLLWLFFISLIASGVIIVLILILNPKIDRQKLSFANEEYQKMITAAMQGQKYEIDSSIYEPQDEIDAFNEELKNRQEKKKYDQEDEQ
ncbi:hypothetical protein [Spiroplasma taiwanense]|uniref:Transmembrane protein n=1 Tax=Spiroplasma taiwanense CT-1 TaxID=1276220 RepID=S5LZT0_9MOLU|nr:hypothetical protein [Spiroplasma taiwanense]AGR41212.1 hypothetical protein STAIW_v1c05900 [Spiroplasma taiwanense CT-1]